MHGSPGSHYPQVTGYSPQGPSPALESAVLQPCPFSTLLSPPHLSSPSLHQPLCKALEVTMWGILQSSAGDPTPGVKHSVTGLFQNGDEAVSLCALQPFQEVWFGSWVIVGPWM